MFPQRPTGSPRAEGQDSTQRSRENSDRSPETVNFAHWVVHRPARIFAGCYSSRMQDLPPILVAEDDEDDFLFLRRAIRQAAIENPILRFRDGSELVKFLQQIPGAEANSSA